jgi:hypothetical protein
MQIIQHIYLVLFFFLGSTITSAGITVGEPLELKNVFTPIMGIHRYVSVFHNTNFLPEFYFFGIVSIAPKTPPLCNSVKF